MQSMTEEGENTGFPGLRSWRAMYLIVVSVFVLYVLLLTALSRAYL
jgi:hypothetical protein